MRGVNIKQVRMAVAEALQKLEKLEVLHAKEEEEDDTLSSKWRPGAVLQHNSHKENQYTLVLSNGLGVNLQITAVDYSSMAPEPSWAPYGWIEMNLLEMPQKHD